MRSLYLRLYEYLISERLNSHFSRSVAASWLRNWHSGCMRDSSKREPALLDYYSGPSLSHVGCEVEASIVYMWIPSLFSPHTVIISWSAA